MTASKRLLDSAVG